MNKGVNKKIKTKVKEQKGEHLGLLAATLGSTLLGNMLIDKGVKAKIPERGVMRAGEVKLELIKIFNATSSFN